MQDERRDALVDALADAVLDASEHELAEQAAAASEDMADAAADLRAQFLARVAQARGRDVTQGNTEPSAEPPPASDHTPMRIGRYPLLRRLGSGGMGVVYAAYDEDLDRRLAIKVLHAHTWDGDGRRRERLLREAQAMARVAHPNVVTVHEVGADDDQPYVAMEFVSGPTLKEWLAERRRTWREIVPLFRQVAEGLAALHDAGLVHRDVKPANVIVGDDGRVRVLDLGLVGAGGESMASGSSPAHGDATHSSDHGSSSRNRLLGPLTMTGERLGTPAYMSREHFMGLELTPASDVFSLCVALYEALHGVHPFKADSFYELQANVIAGRITPPPNPNTVPTWLHTLVVRGLAPDPDQRPASMHELATALADDPGRRRRRWLGTAGVAALTAVAAVFVTRAQTPTTPPTCTGAEQAIATVWNENAAAAIDAAMQASERSYAPALGDRMVLALDDYAQAWAEAHERVCLEHSRGEHSDALLDARMTCLAHARQALTETVAVLADADADVIDHAGELIARLPRLDGCDDLAALARDEPPPLDPVRAAAGVELEALLVRAETLATAGQRDEATTLARSVAASADAHELPALQTEALLTEARAAMVLQVDRHSTLALLDRALAVALERGFDPLAAEAMIRRIYLRGLTERGNADAIADLPIAAALLARAGDDPELRALLLNNAGSVRLAAGQREAARVEFERALELKERLYGAEHLEVAIGLANLGMLTSDEPQRQAIHARTIQIFERLLGPEHPRTLDARMLDAFYTSDPEQAGAELRELCPRLAAAGEPRLFGDCELGRAQVELARGRFEIARPALLAARAQLDEQDPRRALIDAQLADDASTRAAAIAALTAQLDDVEPMLTSGPWWLRLEQGQRRIELARLLADQPERAVELLERALVDLEAVWVHAPPVERERLVATAQSALARALHIVAPDDDRITSLAATARGYYQHWPRAYARRLDELDLLASPTG